MKAIKLSGVYEASGNRLICEGASGGSPVVALASKYPIVCILFLFE